MSPNNRLLHPISLFFNSLLMIVNTAFQASCADDANNHSARLETVDWKK